MNDTVRRNDRWNRNDRRAMSGKDVNGKRRQNESGTPAKNKGEKRKNGAKAKLLLTVNFGSRHINKEDGSNWAGVILMWDANWVGIFLLTIDMGGVLTAIIFSIRRSGKKPAYRY